jgi:DNA-directed RNA polymerase subunit RPC12/RpoP
MAKPSEYVLDPFYRMMVCPACVKDRRMRENVHKEVDSLKKEKPAGFDKEDEYLERTYKEKMKQTVVVEKFSENKVKYKCPKCSYEFLYDTIRKTPGRCPYCATDILRMRFQ